MTAPSRHHGRRAGRLGAGLLVAAYLMAAATLAVSLWPRLLSPEEAPGVDAPACGWGVLMDVHPDIAPDATMVHRCEQVIASARVTAGGMAAATTLLVAAGLLVRRRDPRAAQRS